MWGGENGPHEDFVLGNPMNSRCLYVSQNAGQMYRSVPGLCSVDLGQSFNTANKEQSSRTMCPNISLPLQRPFKVTLCMSLRS